MTSPGEGTRLEVLLCDCEKPVWSEEEASDWDAPCNVCKKVPERIPVVLASHADRLEEALRDFLIWFDARFSTGGKDVPGLTLYSIAEHARAALQPEEPEG